MARGRKSETRPALLRHLRLDGSKNHRGERGDRIVQICITKRLENPLIVPEVFEFTYSVADANTSGWTGTEGSSGTILANSNLTSVASVRSAMMKRAMCATW